jgi:hypothetical protein
MFHNEGEAAMVLRRAIAISVLPVALALSFVAPRLAQGAEPQRADPVVPHQAVNTSTSTPDVESTPIYPIDPSTRLPIPTPTATGTGLSPVATVTPTSTSDVSAATADPTATVTASPPESVITPTPTIPSSGGSSVNFRVYGTDIQTTLKPNWSQSGRLLSTVKRSKVAIFGIYVSIRRMPANSGVEFDWAIHSGTKLVAHHGHHFPTTTAKPYWDHWSHAISLTGTYRFTGTAIIRGVHHHRSLTFHVTS